MGSADLTKEDWELSQLEKSPFGSDLWNNMNSIDVGLLSGSRKEWSAAQENQTLQKRGNIDSFLLHGGSSSDSGRTNSDLNFDRINQTKRRGRKPEEQKETMVNHVQAERQRREKLNRRFYALRSAVPNVSKMDKASLLADAVVYINKLKAKIEELKLQTQSMNSPKMSAVANAASDFIFNEREWSSENFLDNVYKIQPLSLIGGSGAIDVDVKIMGAEAFIRAYGHDQGHPPARLMNVLRELDLQIHHASISKVKELMLQDVVVRLPEGLTNEKAIRSAVFKKLNN